MSDLPKGLVPLNEIDFDIRGLIQLASSSYRNLFESGGMVELYLRCSAGLATARAVQVPSSITNVMVAQRCRQLHLLLGAHDKEEEGTVIARVVVRYADSSQTEIPIRYGQDVRTWVLWDDAKEASDLPKPVWHHHHYAGAQLRLYLLSWTNPRPDAAIASLDLVSSISKSTPFFVAITADEGEPAQGARVLHLSPWVHANDSHKRL